MSNSLENRMPYIMVVDDNITNLQVAKQALANHYRIIPAISGGKALRLLEKATPALILLDVRMPDMDGFETLRCIKEKRLAEKIPVIFLTSVNNSGSELEGLALGAVDYIIKPFSGPLLLRKVQMHIDLFHYAQNLETLVNEKTEIIKELQYAIVHTITDLIECRDGSTGSHTTRTQIYLDIMLDEMKKSGGYEEVFEKLDRNLVIESASLHDLGKIAIPDSILLKPGKLTDEEFEIMKTHTTIGEEAIRRAMLLTRDKEFLQYAAVIAGNHHEKWDGSGYPKGLKGRDIPLLGRLMAFVDVYDALVSERPYKKAFSHQAAVEIIRKEAGRQFDPDLTYIFVNANQRFHGVNSSH